MPGQRLLRAADHGRGRQFLRATLPVLVPPGQFKAEIGRVERPAGPLGAAEVQTDHHQLCVPDGHVVEIALCESVARSARTVRS